MIPGHLPVRDGFSLDVIEVPNPCGVPWAAMRGTDSVRHCGECRKSVYNLSAMTRDEAERLVRAKEGRLCVQFYRRADGTVATSTCTRAARFAGRTAAAAAVICGGLLLAFFRADNGGGGPPWYETYQPFRAVVDWFTPASSYKLTRGEGCLPPMTGTSPAETAPAPRAR